VLRRVNVAWGACINSAEAGVCLRRARALRRTARTMITRARPKNAPMTPPAITPFLVEDAMAFWGRELACEEAVGICVDSLRPAAD